MIRPGSPEALISTVKESEFTSLIACTGLSVTAKYQFSPWTLGARNRPIENSLNCHLTSTWTSLPSSLRAISSALSRLTGRGSFGSHPPGVSASCQLIRLLYSLPCKWKMRSTTSDLDRSTERMPLSCDDGRSGGSVWANIRAAQKPIPPKSRSLRFRIYCISLSRLKPDNLHIRDLCFELPRAKHSTLASLPGRKPVAARAANATRLP